MSCRHPSILHSFHGGIGTDVAICRLWLQGTIQLIALGPDDRDLAGEIAAKWPVREALVQLGLVEPPGKLQPRSLYRRVPRPRTTAFKVCLRLTSFLSLSLPAGAQQSCLFCRCCFYSVLYCPPFPSVFSSCAAPHCTETDPCLFSPVARAVFSWGVRHSNQPTPDSRHPRPLRLPSTLS